MQISVYWSEIVFFDYNGKGSKIWLFHQIVALNASLILCAINTYLPIIMISIINDISHVFFQAGKLFKFSKPGKLSAIVLCIFSILWFILRIIVCPEIYYLWIVKISTASPACQIVSISFILCMYLNMYWVYRAIRASLKFFQ